MRKLIAVLGLSCSVAWAVEPPPPPAMAPVPDAAPQAPSSEDVMEPQVTIIHREKELVEEYRIHGQLYMIKVTPQKGPVYYLVDSDGDGSLESHRNELDPKILVPSWVILRW